MPQNSFVWARPETRPPLRSQWRWCAYSWMAV